MAKFMKETKKPKKPKEFRIDPNRIRAADPLRLMLIQGVTKGGAFLDRKKDGDRKACRGPARLED